MDEMKIIVESKPIACEKCGDKLFYKGGGAFQCQQCEHMMYDDFGKVKLFLEQNGPSASIVIAEATGVSLHLIESMLRDGKLEIPEGSKYYLGCEKCGCSIRYGRLCPQCAKELTGVMKGTLYEMMGEKPKNEPTKKLSGKMRFSERNK